MKFKQSFTVCLLLIVMIGLTAKVWTQIIPIEDSKNIMPMRERVKLMQKWWDWKKKHVLPMVMREQGVDMWIVRNNEADLYYNNEGPVYTLLLPANHEGMTYPSQYVSPRSQRVPRFMMFYDTGKKIEYVEPKDYTHITKLVAERDPKTIAIGQHNNEDMLKALGKEYAARSINSWTLGVRWLETMSREMISVYSHVQRIANEVIAEAYSNRVITPDVTTTDDLNWWIRHKYLELDLETENHPSISVQRSDENLAKYDDPPEYFHLGRTRNGVNVVIRRGEVVSCDTDLFLLGLVTDSHQHAYVLKKGETDVPEALKEALRKVNRIQDLFRKEFKVGRTGKEIVAASNKIPREVGIIESELGFHPPPMFLRRFLQGGYMFDHKTYVAGMTSGPGYYPTSIVTNDHKLHTNTLYAFEPHTRVVVPGWKDGLELGIGQISVFTENGLQYLARPQEHQWHIIK
ncbi:MAG TPA: M24 family metallopeptidase [Candidatus Heimdallarchaeota archaeon]|nr:M24 family metallopeptidase [Candidatus Heimdallarchaeota archaeon]